MLLLSSSGLHGKPVFHPMRQVSIILVSALRLDSCQSMGEELPEWIPKDSREAARRLWEQRVNVFSTEWLNQNVGLDSKEEASTTIFKYPHIITKVDYEHYEEGDEIFKYFLHEKYDSAFGFLMFQNEGYIGHIMIYKVNGEWIYMGAAYGCVEGKDVAGSMYSAYPIAAGYKVYYEVRQATFFMVKNDQVRSVFRYNSKQGEHIEHDALEYMLSNKKGILDWKKRMDRN